METWEQILVGILGLLVVLWMFPGIRPMIERSKKAPKDWPAFILPLALVVALVVILALSLR